MKKRFNYYEFAINVILSSIMLAILFAGLSADGLQLSDYFVMGLMVVVVGYFVRTMIK